MIESGKPQMTIWPKLFAYWIIMATKKHSEYVILLAFVKQKLLCERASMLGLYVHCMSFFLSLSLTLSPFLTQSLYKYGLHFFCLLLL
jgi:hypothetical protein